MQILNIAGYKFIPLSELNFLQAHFQEYCVAQSLKGTLLLSEEGINISLAGTIEDMTRFKIFLRADSRFSDIMFRETYSLMQPFQYLKVRLKKEIITLKQPEVNMAEARAPSIQPALLKQWLDEAHEMSLLDARNDYEIQFGAFNGAINLHIDHFSEFPAAGLDQLDPHKPVVMYCTGGIRCEKAAIYLMRRGFSDVYQLDGGILGYFAAIGGAYYSGECFVFDERVTVGPDSLV
jgi:UPF0176 protein